MAIDTTIHRDADGRVVLTTEQAEAVAGWVQTGEPAQGLERRSDSVLAVWAADGETLALVFEGTVFRP